MTRLDQIARTRTAGEAGPLASLGWGAATALILLGGMVVAASFLAPGIALAGSLPGGATGAHVWIADGGPEIGPNPAWRVEIALEYIALGCALIALALRFGKSALARLQDWYEGVPLAPRRPLLQTVPALIMPRPGHGRASPRPRRALHHA